MNTRKLPQRQSNPLRGISHSTGTAASTVTPTLTPPAASQALRLKMLPALLASSFGVAGLLLPGMALANPQGGQVVAGQATFNQQGNILTIANTPNAIINWQNFSISANEITRFLQQNGDSAVLNRIIGQNPSQILGALQSNGKVFLLNPNGILFGRDSQVNVNGLVASSLNLSDADFLSGKRHFLGSANSGSVKNEGAITAGRGGNIYLIAPSVENSGIISAPNGDVLLAAGHSVQLVDAGNPDISVLLSNPTSLAQNLGQMVAEGGRIGIYGSLVRQAGRVSADSAVLGENGKIIFKASHDTLLDANSQTSAKGAGKGGEIEVLGERVALLGNASVDASGAQGGGTILVGGDVHGANAQVQNAARTIFDHGAVLRADAGLTGDGGKVIVWSDGATNALGTISAKGGSLGGNGGFVETSGKKTLDFHARVNVSASKGKGGTLLLDPASITLVGGTGDGASTQDGDQTFQGGSNPAGTVLFSDNDITTAGISNIYQSELEGLASDTNIILEATDYIHTTGTFTGGLVTLPNNASLTLRTRNSYMDGTGLKGIDLTTSTEGSNLEFRAQGSGAMNISTGTGSGPQQADILLPKLTTASGTITVSGTGVISVGKSIFTQDKDISLTGSDVHLAASSTINAGNANIDITANGAGGAINFGTSAALSLTGTAVGTGVHLVSDNLDLANGAINVGINRRVLINPFSNGRDLDITASKGTSHLDLTPAELNNITAGDLVLNSFGTTSVSAITSVSGAKRLALFGPNVSIQNALSNTQADSGILLAATGALDIGAAGSVTRNGSTGRISIVADTINFSAAATGSINAGAGGVEFAPNSTSTNIEIGGSSRGGVLGISSSDISKVAASVIEIGSGNVNWDGNTTVTSAGLTAALGSGQLNILGGKSTGNVSVDGAMVVTGNLTLSSKKLLRVNTGGSISATNILLEADQVQLQGAPGSITSGSGTTWIVPATTGTKIDLGSGSDSTPNTLELSNTELKTITGTGTLRIGNVSAVLPGIAQSGDLVISNALTPGFAGLLALEAGGGMTQSGSLTNGKLSLHSVESITLDSGNFVDQLAATVGDNAHQGRNFKFVNNQALNIAPTLDGNSGITVVPLGNFDPLNPAGVISLKATGALTQSPGALLGSNAVYAEGSNVDLTQHNPVGVVAGHSTGTTSGDMWHYSSANGIYVTTVDGHSGIVHDGAFAEMGICLKAGGSGVSQDMNAPLISMLGGGVYLDTSGQVNLASSNNNVGMVFGENTGAFTFYNTSALTVGGSGLGVKTSNQPIIIHSGGKLAIANPVNSGTAGTELTGKNVDIGASIKGSDIEIVATQASGKIKTGSAVAIGDSSAASILMEADGFDFTAAAPTFTTMPSTGKLGFVNHTDDLAMTINSQMAANINSPIILFGNSAVNDSNTTSSIVIAATYNQPNSIFGFGATGSISQTAPITGLGLALRGGSSIFTAANQFHQVAAITTGGNFELTNSGALSVGQFSTGQQGTISGISTSNGAVVINNTGAVSIDQPISSGSGAISVVAHSPLVVNAQVTSTTGSILLEAGASNSVSDILTINSPVTTSGAITLKAGATVQINSTVSGTPTVLEHQNGSVGPTLEQCIAAPTLPGCSAVLPTLPQCIATPTQPGCSVVLPTLTQCIANPGQSGCSVVLPTLSQCTANPAQPGCSVVLPSLTACIATPGLPGCSAVLPSMTACIATPTLPGCSVVLPNLAACIASPTLPGCSVVLPNLTACIATPNLPGCSVVLPGIAACTAEPTLPGCTVVLPALTACIANPALPGCSAVLPNITACIATPTLPGCSVILPNLAACIATPSLPGCSVVLPNLAACIAEPTLPGCSVTLPGLAACIATPSLPGCSVVLPNLTACIANPGLSGCSVVLPGIAACITTPSLPGCAAVLPNMASCLANPDQPGCSVILPNLATCIANPGLPGCAVILPNLAACTATPSLPGCSVILPNLTACIANPGLARCAAVLPAITACISTPNLPGCSVVLPTLAQCTSTPSLPGCVVVLPPTQQGSVEPVTQALKETVNFINNVPTKPESATPLAVTKPVATTLAAADDKTASSTDSAGGAKVEEKKDEKKDDKKDTLIAKDTSTAKKDEPAKKLYCN